MMKSEGRNHNPLSKLTALALIQAVVAINIGGAGGGGMRAGRVATTLAPIISINLGSLRNAIADLTGEGMLKTKSIWSRESAKEAKQIIRSLPTIGIHGLSHSNFLRYVKKEKKFIGNVAVIPDEIKNVSVEKFKRVVRQEIRECVFYGICNIKDITETNKQDLHELPVIIFIKLYSDSNRKWRYPAPFLWQDTGFAPQTIKKKLLGRVGIRQHEFKEIKRRVEASLKGRRNHGKNIITAILLIDEITSLLFERTLDLFVTIAENEAKANALAKKAGKRQTRKSMLRPRDKLKSGLQGIETAI